MTIKDNNPHPDKNLQLVTSGSSLVAQEVQRASRQLALAGRIGTQLVLNDERRRWVTLLINIKAEDAIAFLSRQTPLSLDSLERYKEHWDWVTISESESISWSLELLEYFEDQLYWNDPDTLFGGGLSYNDSLPWSIELLERFDNYWDWGFFNSPSDQWGLSTSKALPWSIELLEHFEERWDWGCLSGNAALPWSLELLEYFENNWVWKRSDVWSEDGTWTSGICGLSENRSLPWSLELLERFEERWDWSALSHNESLPWTMDLLVRFKDRWNWSALSAHKSLPWADLLKLFDAYSHFDNRSILTCCWQQWLDDPNIPKELLERYKEQWNWSIKTESEVRDSNIQFIDEGFGINEYLELLKNYADELDWDLLSWITSVVKSNALPWPIDLLEDYESCNQLETNLLLGISLSESASWSVELIERIDNHFDEERHNSDWDWEDSYQAQLFRYHHEEVWARLSRNKSLPWSQELTERFTDLWNLWEQESVTAVWSIENLECIEEDWEWDDKYSQYQKQMWNLGCSAEEKDRWIWDCLSWKESLPWSIELLEHFEERWDWHRLSWNKSLPWSVELIERFKESWDWEALSQNTSLPKLPLTAQDIDNIMKNITNVE